MKRSPCSGGPGLETLASSPVDPASTDVASGGWRAFRAQEAAMRLHNHTSSPAAPLNDRVVIITGGSKGLGAAISARCAAAGARVVLVGRDGQALREHAATLGQAASWIQADLNDPAAPTEVLAQTLERHGRVDGLVNNAGTAHFAPIERISASDIDLTMSLDVRAPLLLSGAAALVMREGGSIVNVSSTLSAVGSPATALYAAAKGALDAATRALAAELGPRNIRVNGVRPGLTRTEATELAHSDGVLFETYRATVPLGRTGTGAEVGDAVVFLLSSAAAFITGQTLAVDGGHTTSNLAVRPSADRH
ncbi:glucose 1-dehydrogenase [Curtobacterium citreum]|uniref:SDR family NAD(P)-dependent oxidoreductase n=2 Tax=Microbacteriaceae TaxID=85023 RepID=UPI00254CCCBC|nr:glucose 1-dehydrogenase [Curtobacterium citreum]MDK8172289.1 glucose 1-dehydrogenase [Curtobacterium citreum]